MKRSFFAGDALDNKARGFIYENAQRLLLLKCLMKEGRSIAIGTGTDKDVAADRGHPVRLSAQREQSKRTEQ
jgi:hypothetical protein